MRRKLDTRFPAARIKKIMQTDEDVGKIALAVPVLMSKALELFLQDLCDRTYRVTLKRGVKTLTSLHLKQCVHSFNEFDFLKDVVSKVPDVGGSDTNADDRSAKRRRISKCGDEDNNTEEETKKRKHEAGDNNTWRGRGRGRGRGRSSCSTRGLVMDSASYDKYEEDPGSPENDCVPPHTTALPEETVATMSSKSAPVRNFDLNLEFVDNGNTPQVTSTSSLMATVSEPKHRLKNGYLEWSIPGMDKIIVDPLHLALSHRILGEEEEDYDNEE